MKKATIQINKKENQAVEIALEDELTIQTVEDAGEKLKNALDNYQRFAFTIDQVNNLDITYIQLLLAFKTSAEQDGKEVSFTFNLPEEMRKLIQQAGFNDLLPV